MSHIHCRTCIAVHLQNEVRLSPSAVQGIFAISFLALSAAARWCQWIALRIGRVQTSIAHSSAGVCLLVAMGTVLK